MPALNAFCCKTQTHAQALRLGFLLIFKQGLLPAMGRLKNTRHGAAVKHEERKDQT